MQETTRAKIKDNWVVCHKCGHKLARVVGDRPPKGLEIKCSSCKEINLVDKCKQWKEPKTPKTKTTLFKVPHCYHCKNYHGFTGNCVLILKSNGLKGSAKARGSRNCRYFEPKQEYIDNYKELKL